MRQALKMVGFVVVTSLLSTFQLGSNASAQETVNSQIDAAQFSSLQAAADAIPKSGGILRIPPGKFELKEPLVIKTSDTKIEGAGTATHIINVNQSGKPAIVIENPRYSGKATPDEHRLWRVGLSSFRVTGNPKSGPGIEARYVEEIFVDGVTLSYHGADGLRLDHCYEDPRICNSLFTYNKACGVFLVGCHDIVVSANQFEENQTGLVCTDGFNLTMSGNNLDDHLGDGVVIENTYGSVVASNMIEECQGWGIVLDRDAYGITLSANVIAHEFSGGIDLRDAHGCTVSANTFTIVKNVGLAVRKDSGSITVTGNNFSDSWIGHDNSGREIQKRPNVASKTEEDPNEAAGVLLEDCEAVVMTGNLLSRLSVEAVVRRGECREILMMGNGVHLPRE